MSVEEENMIKEIFWFFEDIKWNIKCRYNFWLHGPYGLAMTVEKMPFRFIIKYLRKYGATIGGNCRIERGINIHRPLDKRPFENLVIGNDVYLGHNTLIDLTGKVEIRDRVIIASRCQMWTHSSYYERKVDDKVQYDEYYGSITIEEGAIIYSNTVVSYGIKIGSYSRVGACSLVNKDVKPFSFVGGVPARFVKMRDYDQSK